MANPDLDSLVMFRGDHIVAGFQFLGTTLIMRFEGIDEPFVREYSAFSAGLVREALNWITVGSKIQIQVLPDEGTFEINPLS